ncbi:YesL family protein [Promicromonospora sp. CA-289599]|uniref:YesL family protein n=1 Tax=Promicromonospora sp. CA-289599 TaxID=3240014 RepID=UPI003D93D75A
MSELRRDKPGRDTSAVDEVGWTGGVMRVLRRVTRLVEINVLVLLGAVAGGVVLGLWPAVRAASAVLLDGDPAESPWRPFWREWLAGWRRANVLGAPLTIGATALLLDHFVLLQLDGPGRAALQVGLFLVGAWGAVVLACWPRVVLRYDRSALDTWRFLLLSPALGPGTALGTVVVLGVCGLVAYVIPLLGLLAGVAVPLWLSGLMVDERLNRIDEQA